MTVSKRVFLCQAVGSIAALAFPIGEADAGSLQAVGAQYINAYRAKSGLAPVNSDRVLAKVADMQCRLMIANGRIGHSFGPGTRLGERLRKAGGEPRLVAENVARGQEGVAEVMQAWMTSAGHRHNMMHPRMRAFGLAQISSGNQPYWALVLGG
jgi:uncharacterized protein YkwD